jgi:probable rRNA maturation factor
MNLEISIDYDKWDEINVNSIVENTVATVLSEIGIKKNNIEICFLFTNDEEIKVLNNTYRGINKATNVLSFPMSKIDDDGNCENPIILGSIAFAYQTIKRESKEQNKLLEKHMRHLIVHSVLHLLGYDHVQQTETATMEALEVKILKKLNVADPYQY